MIEQQLTTQAAEIAAAGHAGWGNTMMDAAAELTALRKDAERYRKVRRGQHWSVVNGIGDVLRAKQLDAAVDAVPAVGAA